MIYEIKRKSHNLSEFNLLSNNIFKYFCGELFESSLIKTVEGNETTIVLLVYSILAQNSYKIVDVLTFGHLFANVLIVKLYVYGSRTLSTAFNITYCINNMKLNFN